MMAITLPDHATRWIETTRFAEWQLSPMQGDASTRQYARLIERGSGESAIFMICAPDQIAACQTFVRIAEHLRTHGLSTPEIYEDHSGHGLLVIEDLGPSSVKAWLTKAPSDEPQIYSAISEVIFALSNVPLLEGMARMSPQVAAEMLEPYFTYASAGSPGDNQQIASALADVFATRLSDEMAFSTRDFMSENLIWRAENTGLKRLGVIDFQDAFIAPYLYDLVSVAEDARRDVSPEVRADMITAFAEMTGHPHSIVEQDFAIVSLQRNLRILGIFARLSQAQGRHEYQQFVPRVTGFVNRALQHPVFNAARQPIEKSLP